MVAMAGLASIPIKKCTARLLHLFAKFRELAQRQGG